MHYVLVHYTEISRVCSLTELSAAILKIKYISRLDAELKQATQEVLDKVNQEIWAKPINIDKASTLTKIDPHILIETDPLIAH